MPLIASTLADSLSKIYKNDDLDASTAAMDVAKAIVRFWDGATVPAGGTIKTKHTEAFLGNQFSQIYRNDSGMAVTSAMTVAGALTTALSQAILAGGTFGTGVCTPLGTALLIPELIKVYSENEKGYQEQAQAEADAITKFTKLGMCFGSGVEAPTPIPKIGNLT